MRTAVTASRRLGLDAPLVSAVGYGGMHLSIQDRPSEEQAIEVILTAIDAGATLLDTADVYCLDDSEIGHNERLFARALAERPGDRERVSSPPRAGCGGRRQVGDRRPPGAPACCLRSLASCTGVDRIDLYQLHVPDPRVPLAESVGTLADLQREGKVRWMGLSNVSVAEIREAEAVAPVTMFRTGSTRSFGKPSAREWWLAARSRESGSWPTALPAAGGSTGSCRPIPCSSPWLRAWVPLPTRWCSRGCWPGHQP